jgi:hypothetical protein
MEPPEFAAKIGMVVLARTVVAGEAVALMTPVLVENDTLAAVSVVLTLDGIV